MSEQKIYIPRMPDRAVFECFKAICIEYKVPSLTVSGLGYTSIGTVNPLGLSEDSEQVSEDLIALLAHDSMLIDNLSMSVKGFSVIYYRGGQVTTAAPQKSAIYDEILFKPSNSNTISNQEKLSIIAFLNKELKAIEPGRFIESGLSKEQHQLLSIHSSTLERLERLNTDLIQKGTDFRNSLEDKFGQKADALEEKKQKEKTDLEGEYIKKHEELLLKKKLIDEKLKVIDDRDNTHVRRETRDQMLNDVKLRIENFGVSSKTANKRLPVHLSLWVLICIFGLLVWYTASELKQVEITNNQALLASTQAPGNVVTLSKTTAVAKKDMWIYWLWAKLAALSFGLIGTVLYYIKWQNRWAEEHITAEFQIQQFYIDINRANWAIESCLEWWKETDSTIPEVLLKSITNNLFKTDTKELERVTHPADDLASALMGSASKLKMKLGDNELEFNKPGKIKNKVATKKPDSNS